MADVEVVGTPEVVKVIARGPAGTVSGTGLPSWWTADDTTQTVTVAPAETGDYPDALFILAPPSDFVDQANWGVLWRFGPADDSNPAHQIWAFDVFGGITGKVPAGAGGIAGLAFTSADNPGEQFLAGARQFVMQVQSLDDFAQEVFGIAGPSGFIFDIEKDGSVFFNGGLYFQDAFSPPTLTSPSQMVLYLDDTNGSTKLRIAATSQDGTTVSGAVELT